MRMACRYFLVVMLSAGAGPASAQYSGRAADQVATRADMVIRWNRILLQAVRANRSPPPLASRNLAIMHTAMYDAVNSIYRTHQPFRIEVEAAPGTSPEAAAAAAAHGTLTSLYPRQKQYFDRELAVSLADLPQDASRERGTSLGSFVARKILAWRSQDGSANQQPFHMRKGIGFWEPTPPAFQSPLLPGWGAVKPFAIQGPPPMPAPPSLTSAAYTRAFMEVKALGGRHGSARTADETEIAHFWADGEGTVTPPGHWNEIAQTVALARGQTLAENARMFALLNIGLADAAILCWVCKFTHCYWRPITGIQQADKDGNPNTALDPNWQPLLKTPPFPAFTSGHSSFSGTAAMVLADFCGNDQFTFSSTSAGATRGYSSFWQAAEEAGRSRIYGGIHWDFDNTDGLASGRKLGAFVARNYLTLR